MKKSRRLTSLIFLTLLKFTTSLVSLDPALPDPNPLPISPLSIHSNTNNNTVIVVSWDGSMSLAELDSKRIHWTYKSGVPIYSSYQAEDIADTYIDVGLDWQLYIHDKTKGITKRLKTSAKDLVSSTPMSVNGTTIIGQMTTSVSVLDAKTGALVQTFSPMQMGLFDGKNAVSLGKSVKKFLEPGQSVQESGELVYITRTDYAFMAYSESRNVLWNFMYSDVTAEFSSGSDISCSKSVFSMHQTVGLEDKADYGVPTSCQRNNVMVYRIRDRGHSDHLSLVGSVDHSSYGLVGDKEVVPYSVEHPDMQVSVPISGVKEELRALSPFESVAMTAIALPVADLNDGDAYLRRRWWPAFLLLGLFLVLIVGIAMRYFTSIKSKKQDKDLKLKPSVLKKKRTKKVGASKNNNQIDKNEGGGLINGYTEGRQIGKLYISSKEIAKGSNGTVVLEGVYDSRPVAVKRLVQTHHDVALKEIKNLIASDQHPNIVRWYGVEFDNDFVYLSLERCTCNLNDLVSLYSRPQKSAASQDTDLQSLDGDSVHLRERIGRNTYFNLWRSNGYPSTQILKLMRDVVSGLAHLHELGIIHRDLKPHNVLIIKEKTFCAKLSDMGISKRLNGDMTSLTQHATGVGSSGWRAPEQLKNGRQTRAMDLFSLGCVLFFCITGGRHPFGDMYERDANIVNNRKDLFLVDTIPEAFDLISNLLDPNPDLRPKVASVFHHPLFWSPDMRLSFLRDASDRVELEDRENESELLMALESVGGGALGGKWDEKLDNSFLDNISRYRRYNYDSVRDLLRVVRNKLNHYRELPIEIQESLGSVPDGFDLYFTSRFPRLLIEVYKVIRQYCEGEELLSKYFRSSLM